MLAGGTDRLVEELMVMGFGLLGALSQRNDDPKAACRPFDRTRDGFVLGEGAGFLVLERLDHALARGARIHAELLGYGCSANAWRITDCPPDGRGARQSMVMAMKDAGITPGDIDYINAHGTSTQQNDTSESAGILGAMGDAAYKIPVSSTKSMMGHLVAAWSGGLLRLLLRQAFLLGMRLRLPVAVDMQLGCFGFAHRAEYRGHGGPGRAVAGSIGRCDGSP
jgi:3-oxoacyl-[acyl-carrier-protein] synthase II